MIEVRNKLETEWGQRDLAPDQLQALRERMDEVTARIEQKNPFLALADGITRYKAGEKDIEIQDVAKSAAASVDLIRGSFDAVVEGIENMGVEMDDSTRQILSDISGMLDGIGQLAKGIASSNPLSIIQGSISILTSVFDLFNIKDRQAERQIKKHAQALKELETAYNQLYWAIDRALGTDVYKSQQEAISNMRKQQKELLAMIDAENSNKKTDKNKISAYREQYAELERNIADMLTSISDDLAQTDAKTFADELGDALVEAFGRGEDAAEAFNDVVNNVLKNAVVSQLKKNFLETQLQNTLAELEKSMGYWTDSGDFIFEGLSDTEIQNFKDKVASIAGNYSQALEIYSDLLKDIYSTDSESSLSGAVKGVTEETASMVAGQINAVRINQMEATEILRQNLSALNRIADNTAYNRFLVEIRDEIKAMRSANDSLRSQGLS